MLPLYIDLSPPHQILKNPPPHYHSVLPSVGSGGGMIFVSSARQGAAAKLQEPGWGQIQGEDDFRQSSRGRGLLYHDKLLVFPQNASP